MMKQTSYPNQELHRHHFPDTIQSPPLLYTILRAGCQFTFSTFFQTRIFGRHYEPTDGGVVYVSNHQSFLDPMLATMALQRPGNYMARDSLFRNKWFSKLITKVNAMPIKRGAADLGALKESMRRIKSGRSMVIFPEGTRTLDGRLQEFLPGMALLSQRAAAWTVPVIIDGAYENWPRTQTFPSRDHAMIVQYGEPISQKEARTYSPEAFVEHVRDRMIGMQNEVRTRVGRKPFDYDA